MLQAQQPSRKRGKTSATTTTPEREEVTHLNVKVDFVRDVGGRAGGGRGEEGEDDGYEERDEGEEAHLV